MPLCHLGFDKNFSKILDLGSYGESELRTIGIEPSADSLYFNFTGREAGLIELIKLYTEFWAQRYEKDFDPQVPLYQEMLKYEHMTPEGKITPLKINNFMFGHIGEAMFDVLLQWLQVPRFYPAPVMDWRGERVKADFNIPTLGKIELKSCTKDNPKICINNGNWTSENPNITIAAKVLDYSPTIKSRREYDFKITYCELVGFWTNDEIKEVVNQDDPHWYLDTADIKHRWGELSGLLANAKDSMDKLNPPVQTPILLTADRTKNYVKL
jgi:hypothetical protein